MQKLQAALKLIDMLSNGDRPQWKLGSTLKTQDELIQIIQDEDELGESIAMYIEAGMYDLAIQCLEQLVEDLEKDQAL